jgi:hypothetical protein
MSAGDASDELLGLRPSRALLIAIVALAVVVRLAVTVPRWNAPPNDPDNYLPLAGSIAAGRGLAWKGKPTAYRPPLYPIVLASIGAGNGSENWVKGSVIALHVLLGAATVGATVLAAHRWGLSRTQVLPSAGIVAFDPVLVVQAGSVMTETLAAFLVAASLAALADTRNWRAVTVGGVILGLGALCRPSLLPAAVLAALALVLVGPGGIRTRLLQASVLALATAAPLVPWAVRNARVLGEPVWATTHGGYTLALANNPAYYDDVVHGRSDAVWTGPNQQAWFASINRRFAGWSEPRADRAMAREGWSMLFTRPGDFLRATVARLGRFWGLAPAAAVYPLWMRAITAAWTAPLWLALGLGLVKRQTWSWPRVSAVAVLAGLTAVHAVYWTDLRMRAPIVPAIALVAATALPSHRRRARDKDAADRPA